MKRLITEKTPVTETIQLWAMPQSQWHRENYPEDNPFRYEMRTDEPYGEGNILLDEQELTLYVPAGIDLREKAVETLQAEVARIRREASEQCEKLQEQINSLRLLAHMPEEAEDDSIVQSVGPGASNAYVNQD